MEDCNLIRDNNSNCFKDLDSNKSDKHNFGQLETKKTDVVMDDMGAQLNDDTYISKLLNSKEYQARHTGKSKY